MTVASPATSIVAAVRTPKRATGAMVAHANTANPAVISAALMRIERPDVRIAASSPMRW